jgi:hypothetical protein
MHYILLIALLFTPITVNALEQSVYKNILKVKDDANNQILEVKKGNPLFSFASDERVEIITQESLILKEFPISEGINPVSPIFSFSNKPANNADININQLAGRHIVYKFSPKFSKKLYLHILEDNDNPCGVGLECPTKVWNEYVPHIFYNTHSEDISYPLPLRSPKVICYAMFLAPGSLWRIN